jgi:hypothetical protein
MEGGLALSVVPPGHLGRKTFLSKAKLKATYEVILGKQQTITRALKAEKSAAMANSRKICPLMCGGWER